VNTLVQREAAEIREEWMGCALTTRPADRPAAEAAISGLYRLIGYAPPRFHWVSSPIMALETVPPGIRPAESIERLADWPVTRALISLMQTLCMGLNGRLTWAQRPLDQLIGRLVRAPLARSVDSALTEALLQRRESRYDPADRWYAAQSPSWIAHYDGLRRAVGVVFTPEQTHQLDLWAAAVRSCGWWWPREGVCVVSERPVALHTEPGDDIGEVRLHRADGPAIRYTDGWDAHAWHGRRVPAWVITDPSVERIAREPNVEIRRCAIERLGWPAYIEQAGLHLVATAPDPGNPGSDLRLYDMRAETKVLVAVNGSVERDGRRRQYGLTVPGFLRDPVDAAAWTYGLSAEQYSQLLRRT
jgi:hypothetical protein